ncbi:hypothetical protein HMI54_006528 [Coelomomyces lativittatus]|nr:hypothetical protein HMI54_006528 [Coelomomyces lativittatus]KAJ1516785.1 hypothetical protein HMI55_001403 [Coelomomyces lativittatus]
MKSDDQSKLDDKVEFAKFTGISWTKDEQGFFYTRYPSVDEKDLGTETQLNVHAKVYYHRLGTLQKEDKCVFHDPDHPNYRAHVMQTEDGKYLVQSISQSTAPMNLLWIAKYAPEMDLTRIPWIPVVSDWSEGQFEYLANDGPLFFFKTNHLAPHSRIVKFHLDNFSSSSSSSSSKFMDVVSEHPQDTLVDATVVNEKNMVLVYTQDVKHVLYLHDLETGKQLKEFKLPSLGTVDSVSGKRKYSSFFFKFTSFFNPGEVYHCDLIKDSQTLFKSSQLHFPSGKNPFHEFEAKQVFYTSKDGTRIPMFILSSKPIDSTTMSSNASSTKPSSIRPTYLYGYGGFNISLFPRFSPTWMAFLLHFQGHVAIANIRGGGEYGQTWHQSGILQHKQRGLDDFQYAAKYLVAEGYTQPDQLVINGGSNGGLLVCACVNQSPELFGGVIADVPVIDMYRFHLFTIGHAWKADYGDPTQRSDFQVLSTYSPLHTISKQSYPPTLLVTSDHDDRVVPLHSYKYMATLQHVHGSSNPHPLMLLVERKAGHGAGKPTLKRIESEVNKLMFIGLTLKLKYYP